MNQPWIERDASKKPTGTHQRSRPGPDRQQDSAAAEGDVPNQRSGSASAI